MEDILSRIVDNPATAYLISFGGLGLLLMLALNSAHKFFTLSERGWGLVMLGAGAIGGILLQAGGLVTIPGKGVIAHAVAAFAGSMCAAAAAGFSAVDLRATMTKKKE